MKHKKTALKSSSLDFFFSASPSAQNSPDLKIHIRNVAQDTSVYYFVDSWAILSTMRIVRLRLFDFFHKDDCN